MEQGRVRARYMMVTVIQISMVRRVPVMSSLALKERSGMDDGRALGQGDEFTGQAYPAM
jgi:hypothetical protein